VRDPRERLNREILGASVLGPRRLTGPSERLEVVRPRLVTVPNRDGGRQVKERAYRNQVDAGPNAPKLIRLIRHPYVLEQGTPVRSGDGSQRVRTQWLRPESARLIREARSDRILPSWPKATGEGRAIPVRPRVSAEAWLTSRATE